MSTALVQGTAATPQRMYVLVPEVIKSCMTLLAVLQEPLMTPQQLVASLKYPAHLEQLAYLLQVIILCCLFSWYPFDFVRLVRNGGPHAWWPAVHYQLVIPSHQGI